MLLTTAPIFFPDLNNKFFIFANSNSAPMSWREQIGLDEGSGAVTWLRLSEATALIDHDVQKARERLERAISKAWRVRPGGLPQPMLDPNVPLRIQVTLSPGLRIEGRAWLDNPVLHWEASEIECLCKPWTPSSQALPSAPPNQSRARIEVWGEDVVRLWGGDNSASKASAENNGQFVPPPHFSADPAPSLDR